MAPTNLRMLPARIATQSQRCSDANDAAVHHNALRWSYETGTAFINDTVFAILRSSTRCVDASFLSARYFLACSADHSRKSWADASHRY